MKPKMYSLLFVGLLAGLLPIYSQAQGSTSGNIIQNGSFEQDTGPSSNPIPPWNYDGALLLTGSSCQAEDGANCIGVISGQVYQDVETIAGQAYQLSFYVAGWAPDTPLPEIYNLSVLWDGNLIGTTSFDATGETFANMGWSYRSFSVVGTGGTIQLAFINPNAISNPYVPVLDNVELIAIPEPSCFGLMAMGILLLLQNRAMRRIIA